MELKEILAITGKSGLYKFVAKSKHGFVVEPQRVVLVLQFRL